MTTTAPDFDDVPNTADLEPPTSDEVPLATLANTLAIRATRRDVAAIRRDVAAMREEQRRESAARETAYRSMVTKIAAAIVTGGVTMAGAIVGVSMQRGEEIERARHLANASASHDERITKLEERQWR